MKRSQPKPIAIPDPSAGAREYLFDMLDQMARLARDQGEAHVAVHLEAIITSWREIIRRRSP